MPVYYMRHPVHGAKVATMELEVEFDERNGWELYNPDDKEELAPPPVNVLGRRRRKDVEHDNHSG